MKNGHAVMDNDDRRLLGPMSLETLEALRAVHHSTCLACTDPRFRLEFDRDPGGLLVARFLPDRELCSYRGVIHGGVIGLLIDEAMTCCLMAHGVVGVTGDLNLRYSAPVEAGEPIEILSRVTMTYAPLYHVESRLLQSGAGKTKARGRFVRREGEQ